MARKMKRRAIRAWSSDDVKSLRSFAKARMSGRQTAKKLRRTTGAVRQKAFSLGISFRSIGSKK
jgi:hypothetical protein